MRCIAGSLILVLGTSVVGLRAEPAGTPRPPLSDWSRVMRLRPGDPVVVEIEGLSAVNRTMVRADANELIVVNPSAIRDRGARGDLLELITRHPEDLIPPHLNIVAGRLRMAPHGAFVNGQRIGDVSEIVGHFGRERVIEMKVQASHTADRAGVGLLGAVGGFFLGAVVGSALEPQCSCDDPGLQGAVIGAPVGAILGGLGAASLVTPKQEVIFRR